MFRLLAAAVLAARRLLNPPAPGRFHDLTRLFQTAHPDASAEQWEAHADDLCEAAYWEGERRGYDRARGLDEAALKARHDWSMTTGRPALEAGLQRLRDPDDPMAAATPEQRQQVTEALRNGLPFRLVVTPEEPEEPGEDPPRR